MGALGLSPNQRFDLMAGQPKCYKIGVKVTPEFSPLSHWKKFLPPACCLAISLCSDSVAADGLSLTNIAQVRSAAVHEYGELCGVRIEGVLLWASPNGDQLVIQDPTAGIEVNWRGQTNLQMGTRVRLEGRAIAGRGILREIFLDNDGLHSLAEKSEAVSLSAGRHPIQVQWFNGPTDFGLEVQFEGPGLARQPIPDSALWRPQSVTDEANPSWVRGLTYSCFEGMWTQLPDFPRLTPVKGGVAANFDPRLRSRAEQVALQFNGFLEVARAGIYTFWTRSDDGSRLLLGDPGLHLTELGPGNMPVARAVEPGQSFSDADDCRWSETEGVLTFLHTRRAGGFEAELTSGTNRIYLDIVDGSGSAPVLFSKVHAVGIWQKVGAPESSTFGRLLVPSLKHLTLVERFASPLKPIAMSVAGFRRQAAQVPRLVAAVRLQGTVLAASSARGVIALQDGSEAVIIELNLRDPCLEPGQKIAIEGICSTEGPRLVFQNPMIVEHDGIHNGGIRSGAAFLPTGKNPIHLEWFKRESAGNLKLFYEGPSVPRQEVPATALYNAKWLQETREAQWTHGLSYRIYEGRWLRLPDFSLLKPVMEGESPAGDIAAIGARPDVGVELNGYIDIAQAGLYTFSLSSDDGNRLVLGGDAPRIELLGTNALATPQHLSVRQPLTDGQGDRWSQVEGTVSFAGERAGGLELELTTGAGGMRIEVADSSGGATRPLLKSRIRVRGVCHNTFSSDGQRIAGTLIAPSMKELEFVDGAEASPGNARSLPLLTTIEQVKGLSRREAERAYPVKIRGTVTTPLVGGFFIEDSTWAIYVRLEQLTNYVVPRLGDYWEVEGVTFAEFAPNILAHRAERLGTGTMPEPLHPTWDQLINGSLDTRYIEVQGVVSMAERDRVILLTRAGKIKIQLPDVQPEGLKRLENALVRVRGCVIPGRDEDTQKVELGQMRLSTASITVDEPAPTDPFAVAEKNATELLLFDSRAGAFHRVKISGQVVHVGRGEYFVMQGATGFRFFPKFPVELAAGDQVEVAGFPELGGAAPILREALVRRTGHVSLPAPREIAGDRLMNRALDSTLVRVQGRLENLSQSRADQLLEMQTESRGFVARLPVRRGLLHDLLPGSRLELTGVYLGQGGDAASGRELDSFELLLNSAESVAVLARPSWWTIRHTLTLAGGLGLTLLAALVWISQLRRKVEERSTQLAAEVQRREHIERQRALEQERSRIARDLHDDLGATLTQIRFLSALESRDAMLPSATRSQLGQISEKSREMVTSLDEIVWAINPANDSLLHLTIYLCQFAEEFFRPTSIRCRLDVDETLSEVALTSELRHSLYLAVREAFNNIAKHSGATEVWLRIHERGSGLEIFIEDNGRGFDRASQPAGEGLVNMQKRLEEVGGKFGCESKEGTVCRFWLPLQPASATSNATRTLQA
jgi:signal transduction histidine kinase